MTEHSGNGWVASSDPASIGVTTFTPVPGHSFPAGVKSGDVAYVLGYVAKQFHARVQQLGSGCWGYAYRANRNDPNSLSNHASGTAIDINAPLHPNGKAGTFDAHQIGQIHAILTEVDHTIRWGGDYTSTKDEMHFEVNVNAATLKTTADRLRAKARAAATPTAPYRWTHLPLRQGDHNVDVAHAQKRLNIAVDGIFGGGTLAAVRHFQSLHHLTVDGVVGPATAKALG